jgi:hypothetical protein
VGTATKELTMLIGALHINAAPLFVGAGAIVGLETAIRVVSLGVGLG